MYPSPLPTPQAGQATPAVSEPATPKRKLERAATNARLATKHDDIQEQISHMHAKLPGYIRKLIAGYEMRVYWFEVAECGAFYSRYYSLLFVIIRYHSLL